MTSRNQDIIKTAVDLRKQLYSRSLQDKIGKDKVQFNLKEAYKPLLEAQKEQTQEITKTQKETSQAEIQQQMLEDDKLQELLGKNTELIKEIKKQPLIIPLIKSLSNHQKVIDVISGKSDGSDLNQREVETLKQLENVDDQMLRVLIDYYVTVPAERGDIVIRKLEELSTAYSGARSSVSGETRKQLTESQLEASDETKRPQQIGEEIYVDLMNVKKFAKEKVHRDDSIGYKFSIEENRTNFLAYLDSVNFVHDLSRYPFTVIREVNPRFYNEIEARKKEARGKGMTTKFLSSDPKELLSKLNILVAEKEAGNTNVLSEASAIIDELRRLGVLTLPQIKNIYKLIT